MTRRLSRFLDYANPVYYGIRCWLSAFGYTPTVTEYDGDVIA